MPFKKLMNLQCLTTILTLHDTVAWARIAIKRLREPAAPAPRIAWL
jgi:hypothetical protein